MTSKEQEEFYAENLIENLNKDEMISLPISSMHRILNIYKEKNGMNIKEKDKIGSFIFRYFKIHGEDSVLLFLIFNISNMDFDYFDLFLTYCSDSFNYKSIQKLLIKTIIDLTNVAKSQKEQINECNENIKLLDKQIKELKKSHSDHNSQIQQNTQEQMIKIKKNEKEINDLKKLIQEQSLQIKMLTNMQNDIKNTNEQKINHLELNFASINEKLNQNESNIKQQYNEINILRNKQSIQSDEINTLKNKNTIQSKEINDLMNNQSYQDNQISQIKKNIISIESKNNQDINNIQFSIKQLTDNVNQFRKEYDDKTKFKYKSKNDFEFNGSNKFDGIINYLSKKCRGNVHRNGIVNVTASSIHNSYLPQYIVELNNHSNYFHSQNQPNSWIQYDFIDNKVRPTAYSIRTRHDYGRGHNQPKNWCIEGSNDRINWTVLDLQSNITFLDGTNLSHTFNIEKKLEENECYRYLRYRLTGPETQGNYKLVLSALEFFGSLVLI